MTPTISVIGSCRVHNPISRLEKAQLITTNNHGLDGFCHSPREALQKIRFANRRLDIPPFLHEYVFGREKIHINRADFSKSSMFIVEFSSVRRLCIDSIELQLNFVTENLVKPYALEDWLSKISKLTRHSPQGKKTKVRCEKDISEMISNIVNNISMSLESDQVICDMMDKIVSYVRRPVIFVGHFNITKDDGTLVADRSRLNKCMQSHAYSRGYHFFDPTELISMYGQNVSLRDNNHWHSSFELVVGHYLYQNFFYKIHKGLI
ncbi:hypothetical protein GVN72_20205 [Aeromonas caviae]|uniref:hypothetical protein n=1 Tax=Aeromonas caviae TaxID=648 RepID=UPI001376CCA4|nr:hypothetical protein [Aeromonas caviae]NBA25890.1 hypothetical protein [Aeromonas caviae]